MAAFQKLADEAFADLPNKAHHPHRGALRKSARLGAGSGKTELDKIELGRKEFSKTAAKRAVPPKASGRGKSN
jgi:hypothetical protein